MLKSRWTLAIAAVLAGCLVGPLINGCAGGDDSSPNQPVPVEPGELGPENFVTDRAAFAPFTNQILGAFANNAVGIDTSAAQAVRFQLAADRSTLTIEFLNRDTGVVAGPYTLAVDPNFSGGFLGTNLTGFGRTDLMIAVRVRADTGSGEEVAVMLGLPKGAKTRESIYTGKDMIARRTRLLRYWDDLAKERNMCNSLQRFAKFVQDIVDTNLQNGEYDDETFNMIFDDMTDLFVPEGYSKSAMMSSAFLFRQNMITDVGIRCGGEGGKTGYGASFQKGEGRFRHFTANASASRWGWGWVVNITARLTGGDFEFLDDDTGDIAADLATNAAGREFYDKMKELFDSGNLVDGHSVKDWLVTRLSEGTAQQDRYVVLDHPLGPYPAGAQIALCRISSGCRIGHMEEGCDAEHMHGDGILIDDTGPYPDPNETGCGYGKVYTRTY